MSHLSGSVQAKSVLPVWKPAVSTDFMSVRLHVSITGWRSRSDWRFGLVPSVTAALMLTRKKNMEVGEILPGCPARISLLKNRAITSSPLASGKRGMSIDHRETRGHYIAGSSPKRAIKEGTVAARQGRNWTVCELIAANARERCDADTHTGQVESQGLLDAMLWHTAPRGLQLTVQPAKPVTSRVVSRWGATWITHSASERSVLQLSVLEVGFYYKLVLWCS